jgi:hypothetical protein
MSCCANTDVAGMVSSRASRFLRFFIGMLQKSGDYS